MNYRQARDAYLNCNKRIFEGVGKFDIPPIAPQSVDLTGATVIGFNEALTEKHPEDKIVHFFLDDYQFERVWNAPTRYVDLLRRFKAVIAPDFSPYTDFPKIVQIFNHYRKHWCAAWWQEKGITVIPDIQWGLDDPSCFEWCLDGEPRNSLICISTIGGFRSKAKRKMWMEGWDKIISELCPSEILLFGKRFPEIQFDGPMTVVGSRNLENKNKLSVRKPKE